MINTGGRELKIDRLISLIMILLNREKISASKLAEKFGVTVRTIYRDIDTLSAAGIPIVTYPGVNGGIGIVAEYKISNRLFSISDISTLLMGLESISTAFSEKELIGTLEKVKNLIPEKNTDKIELKCNQVAVDLSSWIGSGELKVKLEKVKRAMNEQKYLTFEYFDKNGNSSSRKIEPYQLVLKEGHWYIQGYCDLREDFRIFKLSRVSMLSGTESTYTPREFIAQPLTGNGWVENKLISAKLLVHKSLREELAEYCSHDSFRPYDENRLMVDFTFTDDDRGYSILLSFGDKCECLEPFHVRSEVKRRLEGALKLYH